jgi:hypothetical protein
MSPDVVSVHLSHFWLFRQGHRIQIWDGSTHGVVSVIPSDGWQEDLQFIMTSEPGERAWHSLQSLKVYIGIGKGFNLWAENSTCRSDQGLNSEYSEWQSTQCLLRRVRQIWCILFRNSNSEQSGFRWHSHGRHTCSRPSVRLLSQNFLGILMRTYNS